MANSSDTHEKLQNAQEQIARLRDQVETLMRDQVTPAVSEFAGRASSAVRSAGSTVREQAGNVSGQVKDRPLIAVLIAAALGWVVGRTMR